MKITQRRIATILAILLQLAIYAVAGVIIGLVIKALLSVILR